MFTSALFAAAVVLGNTLSGVYAIPLQDAAKRDDYAPVPILPNAQSVWTIGYHDVVTW